MLDIHRVLFPTDRSECAEKAFAQAAFLAKAHDAELHVVHVATNGATGRDAALLPASGGEGFPSNRIVEKVLDGDSPGERIIEYADEIGADLVVMGTHGGRSAKRFLAGSVAERVVREAPCPVLTVRSTTGVHIKRILVPVDFSDRSRATVPIAEALAEVYGARLELLYVIDEDAVPMAHVPLLGPVRVSGQEVQARFHKLMEKLVAQYNGSVKVSGSVVLGHPARDILSRAEEDEIDMIVMSTHGRTGLERMFLGSVAEKVVRRAPCPVFTVKSFGSQLMQID